MISQEEEPPTDFWSKSCILSSIIGGQFVFFSLKTGGHETIGGNDLVSRCKTHLQLRTGIARRALLDETQIILRWTPNCVHLCYLSYHLHFLVDFSSQFCNRWQHYFSFAFSSWASSLALYAPRRRINQARAGVYSHLPLAGGGGEYRPPA